MTRTDWQRLFVITSVLVLGVLAFLSFRAAKEFLSLPIEGGGLLFGPFLGLPLLGIGVMLLFWAVQLAVRMWR